MDFQIIDLLYFPRDPKDNTALIDLYVRIPSVEKFIKWVVKGDEIEQSKIAKIFSHDDANFYALKSDIYHYDPDLIAFEDQENMKKLLGPSHNLKSIQNQNVLTIYNGDPAFRNYKIEILRSEEIASVSLANIENITSQASHQQDFINEVGKTQADYLQESIESALTKIYEGFMSPMSELNISSLQKFAEDTANQLLNVISPDTEDLKAHLLKSAKYVDIMRDSAGILNLAVLFSLAKGYVSRAVLKDLSLSVILMDLSLADLTREQRDNILIYPNNQKADSVEKYKKHPSTSYLLCLKTLKNFTEAVGRLITGHHELHNGKGYPRGIRSSHLTPLVRILSLSVDTFEHLKRFRLLNPYNSTTILEVLQSFIGNKLEEPHNRRHSTELVQGVIRFIET